jgi:hypothetical protein
MSSVPSPSEPPFNFGDDARTYNILKREKSPPRYRVFRFLAISLFVLAVLLIPLMIVLNSMGISVIPRSEGLGKVIEYKRSSGEVRAEVFYRDGATEDDARKLGKFLDEEGYFPARNRPLIERPDQSDGATVQVRKPKQTYLVACVVKDGVWDQRDVVESFAELRKMLQESVFEGQPVIIHLCEAIVPTTPGRHLTLKVRKVIE